MNKETSPSPGPHPVSRRGFAGMDAKRQHEIASKGGKEAHRKGTAHEFSSAEAREAGRKGGEARAAAHKANRRLAQAAREAAEATNFPATSPTVLGGNELTQH